MPFSDIIGHDGPKEKLRRALGQGHIGHAYLFTGEEAIGKRLMATRFVQALSCETTIASSSPDPCGICKSCRQIASGTHPDLLLIEPEPDKTNPQIKIDRVRDLEHHVIYRPLLTSRKTCLINDAHRLTPNAANALLKTLEDPPDHSLFILITSRPSTLPATVRSRCLSLRFALPTQAEVEEALRNKRALSPNDARLLAMVTNNRIGLALQTDPTETRSRQQEFFQLLPGQGSPPITNILGTATDFSTSERFPDVIFWLSHSLRDLLLVTIGANQNQLLHGDQFPLLQQMARKIRPEKVIDLIEQLQNLEQAPTRNLNLQLVMENFLLRLRDAASMPAS